MSSDLSVLVVGGGLSGLAVADGLRRADISFTLLEERQRLGGRILSEKAAGGWFDLGPTWIWSHNSRMRALVRDLGLATFPQHSQGRLVFEDGTGAIRRDYEFAMMGDALRIDGGMNAVVAGLANRLDPHALKPGHSVRRVEVSDNSVSVGGTSPEGEFRMSATHLIFALPPRLLASNIDFKPKVDAEILAFLENVPTWMAGQSKFVAVYETPFWRDDGLSGDAISHRGPLVEIHDASPSDGRCGALFGFLGAGISPDEGPLHAASLAQLGGLFGPAALTPLDIKSKIWADDPATATPKDRAALAAHPVYGYPAELDRIGNGRVFFAGSEIASQDGGFLEGALIAADAALARLNRAV